MEIGAIILAGGKNTRMLGQDKAFLEIKNEIMINRQLKALKKIFKKIIIVTNNPNKYRLKDVKIVKDIISHKGPLSGIYSGLIASDSFYSFVVACDMPNLDLKLIKYMIKQKKGFDVIVPHLKKGYETLFAIYSQNCILPIYKVINSGNLRIGNFFKKVDVKEITEREIKKFGAPDILFMNINTPLDYIRFCIA